MGNLATVVGPNLYPETRNRRFIENLTTFPFIFDYIYKLRKKKIAASRNQIALASA